MRANYNYKIIKAPLQQADPGKTNKVFPAIKPMKVPKTIAIHSPD